MDALETMGEIQEKLPAIKTETPNYDSGNPYHVRLWELAGKPDLTEQDADGNTWGPTITLLLQSDGEAYLPRDLPEPAPPVTAVEVILTGYAESEAARAERIKLLKSTASYALGSKIAGDLAQANPPTNAEDLAALKAEAKAQASALGGNFFDAYFSWIGAYREGGGPGFLAAVQADTSTEFLDWPTPAGGIKLPDGTVVLAEGGTVEDLFVHFLTPPAQ